MIATYLAALAKEVLAKVPIGSVYQDLSLYLSARFSRIGDELR